MIGKKYILFLTAIIILSMSCASRRQHGMNQKEYMKTDTIIRQIESLVQKGNYTKAIELVRDADKTSTSEIQRNPSYIAALNGLTDSGMNYCKEGDYKRAGSTFKYVINHMSPDSSIKSEYTKTPEQIRSLLITCEDRMMKQGLAQYRNGNLGDAIAIWKDILKSNPDHTEAKNALKTATVQLKNLKKIENK